MLKDADYAVVVYLSQAIVFDILAIIEDGMSQISTIRTAESSKSGSTAGIGASNVFALLGVGLKTDRGHTADQEVIRERIHTPTSLFTKVRTHLHKSNLVHNLTGRTGELSNITPGRFVELEARLEQNPLVRALDAINDTIAGIKVLTSFGQHAKKTPVEKATDESVRQIAENCRRLSSALDTDGLRDLVGDLVPGPGKVVVPVEDRYFGEHADKEIAEGQFRVFGKVVRIVTNLNESVSLLRNTKFAHMPTVLDSLRPAFASLSETNVKIPEFNTEIRAPAILVKPIAIFL